MAWGGLFLLGFIDWGIVNLQSGIVGSGFLFDSNKNLSMNTPLFYGIATGFVMSVSLGAIFFLLVQAGLVGGVKKGLPLALGVISGDFLYIVLALHFSEFITQQLNEYRVWISLIGSLVFFGLAIQHFLHHQRSKADGGFELRLNQMQDKQLFLKALTINLLNPVNIVWWLGLFSLPPGSGFDYNGKWVFGIAALATVFTTELGVSWGASKIKHYLTEERIRHLDLVLGLLFLGMGIYLLTFCTEIF
jgi:threonine/homoserine/homoserine lactone efflux protein